MDNFETPIDELWPRYVLPADQNITNLYFCNFSDCPLLTYPKLQKLRLRLSESRFPTEIFDFQLTLLDLSCCGFSTIPSGIGCLVNLRSLILYRNGLTSLPCEIGLLIHLEHLDLRENALVALPQELSNLPLASLDAAHNRLRRFNFPQHIEVLRLDYNSISKLHCSTNYLMITWNQVCLEPMTLKGLSTDLAPTVRFFSLDQTQLYMDGDPVFPIEIINSFPRFGPQFSNNGLRCLI